MFSWHGEANNSMSAKVRSENCSCDRAIKKLVATAPLSASVTPPASMILLNFFITKSY